MVLGIFDLLRIMLAGFSVPTAKEGRHELENPALAISAGMVLPVKGNKVGEVVVTPEGQIAEGPKWRKKGSKQD